MRARLLANVRVARIAVAVLACVLPLAMASGGCSSKPSIETKAELDKLKKKEKPKPNFDTFKVFTEPNELSLTDPKVKDPPRIVRAIKPGHWTSLLVETKANNFDFSGELASAALDVRGAPLQLDRSPFRLDTTRSVALAKGQPKSMESLFFAPCSTHMTTFVANRLRNDHGGDESPVLQDPLPHMPAFQYFMVVLTRDSSRYTFLRTLDSVLPLADVMPVNPQDLAYYRLITPQSQHPLALPPHALCWTSTAWLLWDDLAPSSLSVEQQQAVIDWLHWGGQIAVSGPAALDLLRGSFLDRYLPADGLQAVAIDSEALAPMDQRWTLHPGDATKRPLRTTSAWAGVKLELRPGGEFQEGSGQLIAERRLGRGRIVVTAFRLTERDLWNWSSFDSFFNGAILRRPPRRFDDRSGRFLWVDGSDPLDPRLASTVRYFTRDSLDVADKSAASPLAIELDAMQKRFASATPMVVPPGGVAPAIPGTPLAPGSANTQDIYSDDLSQAIDEAKQRPGVAAWNDFSAPSTAARQTLREAAGISVPNRDFVLWMLGAYLVAVVPVNWLVFRLLGRVEWAWIAVPVLSIGWGVAVVWLAQLDIGFARSQTEVAVIEMQPDYARAHVTRYTALYSSLSTHYDVAYDDTTALAQPFSPDVRILSDQSVATVTLRTAGNRQLDAFPVSSNSTGMIHTEQMIDLGGPLRWIVDQDGRAKIENQTKLKLSGAVVLRTTRHNARHVCDEAAWLGDLLPGSVTEADFDGFDRAQLRRFRDQATISSSDPGQGGLSLRRLLDCAQDLSTLKEGEARLVAWRDGSPPGQQVAPEAAQARSAAIVMATLHYAAPPAPRGDENLRTHRPPLDLFESQTDPNLDAQP